MVDLIYNSFSGQLTDQGKRDMRQLGRQLRSWYVHKLKLLPSKWDTSSPTISLRSTNYLRTIESLQHLLHGLYPMTATTGNPTVVVKDSDDEDMYPHDRCSSMVLDTNVLRKQFSTIHKDRLLTILNPLSFWHTMDISHANQAYRMYDMLSCLMGNHIEFPEGVTEDDHGVLEGITVDLWARLYENDETFTKRAIGRFIPSITESILDAHQNPKSSKASIFSGHDSTLIPIMIAFQNYGGQYPRFSSNVITYNLGFIRISTRREETRLGTNVVQWPSTKNTSMPAER
jgi:acid phosphatase